jgi:serine/threonine-protein kinase HipA
MKTRGALDAWLYGTRIATISDDSGRINLRWTPDAAARWGEGTRIVSELLPVAGTGEPPHHRRVEVFLENLLPEGNARHHLAFDAGITNDDTFGMIEAYGRDTAGALIFVPSGSGAPDRGGQPVPLTAAQVGAMIAAAGRNAPALGAVPHLQSISLAGMQPKIALARTATGWARCVDGYPSTHILKLAHPTDSPVADVVHTEAASLALARTVGLTTVSAELARFGRQLALVISRYDRVSGADGPVRRIHQEDSAQALGISPADPGRKFQHGRQLPSLAKIAQVLRNGGAEPDRLLMLTTFNLAVGNTDAHAKNISILRHPEGRAELAPAYDTAMHLHHQGGDRTFAMDVNGKRAMDEIGADDLIAEASTWPLSARRAIQLVADTLGRLSDALDSIDTAAYPGVPDAAWEVVARRTRALLAGVPAITPPRPRTGRTAIQPREPKGTPRGGRFTAG